MTRPQARLMGAPARFGPANVLRGLRASRTGELISLNRELDEPAPFGRRRFKRTMRLHNQIRPLGENRHIVLNDDEIELALQASSQWDAFSHFGLLDGAGNGVFHDGHGLSETFPEPSSPNLGIQSLGPAIVTRGLLLDAVQIVDPALGFLDADARVDRAALEEAMDRQGVTVEPGDAVLIYTGFERRLERAGGQWPTETGGLVADTVALLTSLDVLAVISDNLAVEATPADYSIHTGLLRDAGIPLGELWALEELADACRADGRYEFLLVSVPLNIHGAFGSTANAVAIR